MLIRGFVHHSASTSSDRWQAKAKPQNQALDKIKTGTQINIKKSFPIEELQSPSLLDPSENEILCKRQVSTLIHTRLLNFFLMFRGSDRRQLPKNR